jgi:peptidoglycan/LPS O-acetylase OafA/YrhL
MYRLETKMISMRTIYAFLLFLFGILFLYIDYHQYTIFNSSNLFLNEVYTFNLFIGLLIIFLITLKVKNLTILSTNLSNVLGKISYGIYCWHFFIIAVFFDMFFDGAGGIFVRQPILISNVSLMYIPFLLIPFIIAGICNYFFLEKFFNRFRLTV